MKKIIFTITLLITSIIGISQTQNVTTTNPYGTSGYIPKFTTTINVQNSLLYDNGTSMGIGTTSPSSSTKLHVTGPDFTNYNAGSMQIYAPNTCTISNLGTTYLHAHSDLRLSYLSAFPSGTGAFGIYSVMDNITSLTTTSGYTGYGTSGFFTTSVTDPLSAGPVSGKTFWVAAVYGALNGSVTQFPATGAFSAIIGRDLINHTPNDYSVLANNTFAAYFVGKGYFSDNVGINTTGAPSTKLEIKGTSGTTLKIVDGNQGAGKILVSDADGVASWSSGASSLAWSLTGNSGTTPGTNFMGTTDDKNVVFKRNNLQAGLLYFNGTDGNTSWGVGALASNTYATDNIGIGVNALNTQSYANGNIAWSTYNVAVGNYALYSNQPVSGSSGKCNTAIGWSALYSNTTGSCNIANGMRALYTNTTGGANTANGYAALWGNTTGGTNTATGYATLYLNTTGGANTAHGAYALYSNTTGNYNTANGYEALWSNTSGTKNTVIGYDALYNNTTGDYNTALGNGAGINYATCDHSTFIGNGADATGNYSNATAIGNGAYATGDGVMMFGNSTISGLYTVSAGLFQTSDGRFKTNVTENVKGLEFIKKLRPVTYQMNTQQLDNFIIQNMPDSIKTMHQAGMDFAPSTAIIHSGFIAQEVDSVAQACGFTSSIIHTPANSTDPYALNYAEIVVPLVKAVQELSKTADSLKAHQKTSDSLSAIQAATVHSLLSHQQITDSLLAVLQNCCLHGTTQKTMQNDNGEQGNSTSIHNIELANNAVLYQNAPNPFSEGTTIKYFVPDNADAQIVFYDMFGNQLKIFKIAEKGMGQLNIDASNLSAGMYSYSLLVNEKIVDTKKMIKSN